MFMGKSRCYEGLWSTAAIEGFTNYTSIKGGGAAMSSVTPKKKNNMRGTRPKRGTKMSLHVHDGAFWEPGQVVALLAGLRGA